ncbi:MAG: hypothetical protein HY858_11810 [Candidatus Solibacter usitatus]|nr:hypothetical protein [Candidatus Solibacter usitatus]
MDRRRFLQSSAGGAALAAAQTPGALDTQTNAHGTEYYLLGNGLITAGVQSAPVAEAGAQCGLVIMSPDHMNRKTGSLLWHPRSGLADTRLTLWSGDKPSSPKPGQAEIEWTYPDGIPTVRIRWSTSGYRVTEDLWCPAGHAALVRRVTLEGAGEVRLTVTLRPNPLLFDEYDVDRQRARLSAGGYHHIELFALEPARTVDRNLEMRITGNSTLHFVLALDAPGLTLDPASLRTQSAGYWRGVSSVSTGDTGLDHLFRASGHGIRAVVSRSGKMDGGIWQYNLEWVRDASMVSEGAVLTGQSELAGTILDRVLTRMVGDNGAALDSSFHRPPETIELDQNGQLIHALWTHWVWTGDDALVRKHWPRIKATADYPLRAEFLDPRTGLVKNSREFWERGPSHGVRDGYELAYQAWNIAGWPMAAEMAEHLGDRERAPVWRAAAALMKRSFLSDPRYSFVNDGRFIKRRLADGAWQQTIELPDRLSLPPGMPLREERVSYLDPDASSVFPMLLGIVDPKGDVARKTLESVEALWNQRWQIGGYGRYHVTGEPDSPGPWPFATLFIARAYLEAGDSAKVWRALRWLQSVPGGRSGAWFEFYGERPSPPLPQVAIIPWIWAEIAMLVVSGVLGVRPTPTALVIRPNLPQGLDGLRSKLRFNRQDLSLALRRTSTEPWAKVNGRPVPVENGSIRLPRPQGPLDIEISL